MPQAGDLTAAPQVVLESWAAMGCFIFGVRFQPELCVTNIGENGWKSRVVKSGWESLVPSYHCTGGTHAMTCSEL